jgi:hypothetical protein
MVEVCNPSTWEAESGGSRVPGRPELHTQFKASLEKDLVSKQKEKKKKKRKGTKCFNEWSE